jgi:hypothetical protein
MLKELQIRIEFQSLIVLMMFLCYVLHVIGCWWYIASLLDVYDYLNWVTANEWQDKGMVSRYIAALYWATVTCTTVGYGDILPVNGYELIWAIFIYIFGVGVFSFILSNLSSKFSEITRMDASNQEKIQ